MRVRAGSRICLFGGRESAVMRRQQQQGARTGPQKDAPSLMRARPEREKKKSTGAQSRREEKERGATCCPFFFLARPLVDLFCCFSSAFLVAMSTPVPVLGRGGRAAIGRATDMQTKKERQNKSERSAGTVPLGPAHTRAQPAEVCGAPLVFSDQSFFFPPDDTPSFPAAAGRRRHRRWCRMGTCERPGC